MKIAVLAGDGIGPEIMAEARKVLDALGLPGVEYLAADVGGAAYRRHGHPLPPATLDSARAADAVLFGAVGDPGCDKLERHLRPEQAILGLRSALGLFANLRPATMFPGLEDLSALRPEVAALRAAGERFDPSFTFTGALQPLDQLPSARQVSRKRKRLRNRSPNPSGKSQSRVSLSDPHFAVLKHGFGNHAVAARSLRCIKTAVGAPQDGRNVVAFAPLRNAE